MYSEDGSVNWHKKDSLLKGEGLMPQREDSCKYLEDLRADYRVKLKNNFWKDFHSLIREELFKTEYKLHHLKEQELCLQFQLEGTSLSTFLMTN